MGLNPGRAHNHLLSPSDGTKRQRSCVLCIAGERTCQKGKGFALIFLDDRHHIVTQHLVNQRCYKGIGLRSTYLAGKNTERFGMPLGVLFFLLSVIERRGNKVFEHSICDL